MTTLIDACLVFTTIFVGVCFVGVCFFTILSVRSQLKTQRTIREIRAMFNG